MRASLLWVTTPSLRAITPTPRGEAEDLPQASSASAGLPQQNTESAPLLPPTPVSIGDLLTTLQCSLYATARRVARPPGQVRPGALLRPPRTCTPELARGRSPGPRVGYDYTALLGENCGRTFTGWSTAVTGCTFWCKLPIGSKRERIHDCLSRRQYSVPHLGSVLLGRADGREIKLAFLDLVD